MRSLQTIVDERFGYVAAFDQSTGGYIRSGDPFMASFPHLLDIGIMGHCLHGKSGLCIKAGVECYQSGLTQSEPNMPLDEYKRIINQCSGKVFQVALGGRGDPDLHEDFEAIVTHTREQGIVPNLTTSGFGLTLTSARHIANYCGAAAVSWYRSIYTKRAIDMLLSAGVKTNVHYVLNNSTITEAIELLETQGFPQELNRIIFLLHKPVGLGCSDNVLQVTNPIVAEFFSLATNSANINMVGYDSCTVPALISFAPHVLPMTYDTCEGARFSAYVTPNSYLTPCSFDQELRWGVDLRTRSLEDAWFSQQFEEFRGSLLNACIRCRHRKRCLGGCPISKDIILCHKVQRGEAK